MDEEARRIAERSSTTDENPPKRKRKRKRALLPEADPEVDHVGGQYEMFCSDLREKYFPGLPTLADIGENNVLLRRHVASRLQAVEEEEELRMREGKQLRMRQGGNSGSEVVVQSETIFPPHCRYIQR